MQIGRIFRQLVLNVLELVAVAHTSRCRLVPELERRTAHLNALRAVAAADEHHRIDVWKERSRVRRRARVVCSALVAYTRRRRRQIETLDPLNASARAYSKRVPRTNCALRIKKCAPLISSGIYFFKHELINK